MKAKDVMTTSVVTVRPETKVRDIARRLIERNVSAVPVVDAEERVVGIVSEGDLMRRPESGTERGPSWWLTLVESPEDRAQRYLKSHGLTAQDVMKRDVITASEDTPVEEIASLLEWHRIKRVPIVRNGKIVGIVSRANLLHGLIAGTVKVSPTKSDNEIKDALAKALNQAGVRTEFLNIVVANGVVRFWGSFGSEEEKRAAQVAAEGVAGISRVVDDAAVLSMPLQARYWD